MQFISIAFFNHITMLSDGYHFYGMHLVWWFMWGVLLFWIFATPYDIPFQRSRRKSPLDVLQDSFAKGTISQQEYQERKGILTRDLEKWKR